jgi:branched-chain amino acid transport system ATP-binding protein
MTDRLSLEKVSLAFGGLVVASDVSLSLPPGSRTALIGPNGAGKSTLVNIISGALKPSKGDIRLDGVSMTHAGEMQRVRAGIVRTYQTSRLFKELTVADNIRIAVLQRRREQRAAWWGARREACDEEVDVQLASLQIRHLASRKVSDLSMGEQRLVEIGLALALRPRVLLLDEPAAGVPQGESGLIFDAVNRLSSDMAVLLIEHDMDIVFRFAQRIAVLVSGRMLTIGTPAQVAANDEVKAVYFGSAGAGHGR